LRHGGMEILFVEFGFEGFEARQAFGFTFHFIMGRDIYIWVVELELPDQDY
jgi:hypothetical protein